MSDPRRDQYREAALAGCEAGLRAAREESLENGAPNALGYEYFEKLGEGSYGKVFAVEQLSPKRMVALKILEESSKQGAVFIKEMVMGQLSHPGIATIHTVDPGNRTKRPHFVMELIAEKRIQKTLPRSEQFRVWPITTYAHDERFSLDTRKRIGLILRVLEAVRFFHNEAGNWHIVHRDLKPSNILVDFWTRPQEPQPKILDFGIAVFADEKGQTEGERPTLHTGTPEYMCPKQREAASASRNVPIAEMFAWDLYSLAAIAFEVLSGHRYVPGRSQRLGDTGDPSLGGDLEFVIHKGLALAYNSASEFNDDLQRILEHKPIPGYPGDIAYKALGTTEGRPPLSILARLLIGCERNRYFFTKFYKRRKWATAFLLALITGMTVSAILAVKFSRAADDAKSHSEKLKQQSVLLQSQAAELELQIKDKDATQKALDDILFKVDPSEQRQRALTVDYLLEGYMQTARSYSNRVPEASARVLMAAGRIFDNSGRSKEALVPLVEGVLLWRTIPESGNSERLADGLNWLSWAYAHQHPPLASEAVGAAQECFDIRKKIFGIRNDDTIAAMADLSAMLRLKGDTDSADGMFLGTLALAKGLEGTAPERKQLQSEIEGIVKGIALMSAFSPGNPDALNALDKFLEPVLNRPRLRGRLPWTLAQFGKHIYQHYNKPAGTAIVDHAVELGKKILGSDAQDVRHCEELRDSLKSQANKSE